MERKIITTNDFYDVARNNEYFLWHFLQKNQNNTGLGLFSYFDTRENYENPIKTLLDDIDISYYESYTEDSIDFLNDLGYPYTKLWRSAKHIPDYIPKNQLFSPLIIGFKRHKNIISTLDICYCVEGTIDVIGKLNPEFLLNAQY
jgi:hypothetical protein